MKLLLGDVLSSGFDTDDLPIEAQVNNSIQAACSALEEVYTEAEDAPELRDFIREFWNVVHPGFAYKHGWYIDAMCEHLLAMHAGEITKLIINIPPRHSKSTICANMLPAWIWTASPHIRFIYGSHDIKLALRDNVYFRRIITSPKYRARWGHMFNLSFDQNTKGRIENDLGGFKQATSVGANITGEGANWLVADDPLSVRDVHSEAKIKEHIRWWTEVMPSRINPGDHVRYLVLQQRVTGNDLSGYLLRESGDYYHLNIPYEYQPKVYEILDVKEPPPQYDAPTKDPRTEQGEILCPELWPVEKTNSIKSSMSAQAWEAQYNGIPSAQDGNIFKRDKFKFYNNRPASDPLGRINIDGRLVTQLILSVDCSFKEKTQETGSYVPIDVWGKAGPDFFLIDTHSQQLGFDDTVSAISAMARRYPLARSILIEKKANGPGVIATLKKRLSGIIPVEPFGDKVERAFAVQPLVTAGNVYIPNPQLYPWVKQWLMQVTQFPFHPYDDWVDSMAQALLYWTLFGTIRSKYESLAQNGRKGLIRFGN